MTRRCSRCKEEKPLDAFGQKSRGRLGTYCRPCRSAYHREHYLKNKREYIEAAKRRLDRMLELMRLAKDKPCADCGIRYPYYVMDFDHREGEKKLSNVTKLRYMSQATLQREIAKCDVVCANCHRQRTYERLWQFQDTGRRKREKRSLL